MMTPEQRYLFDLTGYLHLENVLSEVELSKCQEATDRYINTPADELPPDFGTEDGRLCANGFAFDKALEALVFHPGYWPIVKEFTDGRPRFRRGSMLVNQPDEEESHAQRLHCAREDFGRYITRYDVRNERIYCNDFVIFRISGMLSPETAVSSSCRDHTRLSSIARSRCSTAGNLAILPRHTRSTLHRKREMSW